MSVDERLSAYLDNDVSPDERVALERQLAAEADARTSLAAMTRVRASLRFLHGGIPGDMLTDFRRRLDEHRTPVLAAPVQDTLRAAHAALGTMRQSLAMVQQRRKLSHLLEITGDVCPRSPLGEPA